MELNLQNTAHLKPNMERLAYDVIQQQPGTTDTNTVDEDAADVGHGMLSFIHLTNQKLTLEHWWNNNYKSVHMQ